MKNFRLWLEELADEEAELLRSYGYAFKDQIKAGDMTMALLEAPLFPAKFRFHLAVNRSGLSAFNIQHQFSREQDKRNRREQGQPGVGIVDGYFTLKPMMEKLAEWLKQYSQLVIASHNEKLTVKWLANATIASRYMGIPISVETEKWMGHTIHLIKLN